MIEVETFRLFLLSLELPQREHYFQTRAGAANMLHMYCPLTASYYS